MLEQNELDQLNYKKYYIRFTVQSEYSIEIKDYVSDEQAIHDFLHGKYDDTDAISTGKQTVHSATVDTVYSS